MQKQITRTFSGFTSRYVYIALFAIVAVMVGLWVPSTSAQLSAELTQSYDIKDDSDAVAGALVSLDETDGKTVVVAEVDNSERLIGVLVEKDTSSIAVNANQGIAQVATSGRVVALVSNINGDIKAGDVLVLSPVRGVAARTTPGAKIVGTAQEDFNAQTEGVVLREVKNNSGETNTVAFGSIPVVIGIGSEVAIDNTAGGDVFGWLDEIAGKPVPNVRAALAGAVALITLTTVSVMIYSSVHNTIYGISRNPLAKQSIFQALGQVMAMVMVVACLGVILIYAIIMV